MSRFAFIRNYSDLTRADDWFAEFEYEGRSTFTPVACWAIARDEEGSSYAVGLVADSDYGELKEAGDYPFFAGYIHRLHLEQEIAEPKIKTPNKSSN